MPSFFLFSFLRQGFTLGQAGLAHVVFLLPHSAEFQDDRHEPHTTAQSSTSLHTARFLPETKAVTTAAALTPVSARPPYHHYWMQCPADPASLFLTSGHVLSGRGFCSHVS